MKINNKGFTLIELLAVLVILTAIMGIVIPNVSSSLERSKNKQDDSKKKLMESAAEIYVSDHKNRIYSNMTGTSCNIKVSTLFEEGLITKETLTNSKDGEFNGCVLFTKNNMKFEYKDSCGTEC